MLRNEPQLCYPDPYWQGYTFFQPDFQMHVEPAVRNADFSLAPQIPLYKQSTFDLEIVY